MNDDPLLPEISPSLPEASEPAALASHTSPDAKLKRRPIEVTVVVPTFNERDNVIPLVKRLDAVLSSYEWEVVFVDDDSPDGTADVVRGVANVFPQVRCIQRIGRRGLSRAVIEGALSASAPVLAVIDADLQHDEAILPTMLKLVIAEQLDIVIGSRYCESASIGTWDPKRAAMSRFATALSRMVVRAPLSDPMSGFFAIRRSAFMAAVRSLSGEGYKILLDIFASSPVPPKFSEVPYTFRNRLHGESKLDSAVAWEYMLLIIDKRFGHILPARFILFSLVGLSGVIIHFAVLWAAYHWAHVSFAAAQTMATVTAMSSNYTFNNILTYRDRRRRGYRFLTGLLSFYLLCGVGVIANVGIANFAFRENYTWWMAGGAGAVVGTVWNYVATSLFTWGRRR